MKRGYYCSKKKKKRKIERFFTRKGLLFQKMFVARSYKMKKDLGHLKG